MRFSGAQKYMLPWLYSEIEEMDAVFGGDPWKYGIEPNRPTLSALIDHMVRERLVPHAMELETLFIPI
jgi:4,5-dihydroxyphthalate decarboxylase